MQPQNEQLTPKQRRFFIAAFLLIFLTFGTIIGAIAWKGNQAHQAKQKARLAQIARDDMTRKKEREQRKKNAGKPTKKRKMVQIQQGATKQVTLQTTSSSALALEPGNRYFYILGPSVSDSRGTTADSFASSSTGITATKTGVMTVNNSSSLGIYSVQVTERLNDEESTTYIYEFEVIAATETNCPTLDVTPATPVFLPNQGLDHPDGSHTNGVWSYTWNYTLTGTNADRYRVALSGGDNSTSNSSSISTLVAPGATISGNISIEGLHPDDACTSSSPFSITAPPVYQRVQCLDGNCAGFKTTDADEGYATVDDCLAAGCGFPSDGWYCVDGTPTHLTSATDWNSAGRPTPRYDAESGCPCYTLPAVFWCVAGHVQSGTTPPAGVTTYASEQACINAGCTTEPPVYTRYRCNSSGVCESFTTPNPTEAFATCDAANCSGIIEPTVYTRYHCDEEGNCESFLTFNPTEGYEDCAHANCATPPPPQPCDYLTHPIANISAGDTLLSFSLSRLQNDGWQLVVTHALDGVPQSNPPIQTTTDAWNWSVPHTPGVHHFIAELTKAGCPAIYTTELSLTVTSEGGGDGDGTPWYCVNGHCVQTDTPPSEGIVTGPFATATLCNAACGAGGPCPPPPDAYVCSPAVSIQAPTANVSLHNFTLIKVQLSDPNEETNPCHHNYPRPCNHEENGPDLQLFLGEYHVPANWKRISGTPLNGVWQTLLDTRDYSNGTHTLRISSRGVGCCRIYNTVTVTLANTLQGNIFYRDTRAGAAEGFVIGDAMIGVETRALEANTSRRYWQQWGVRSGTALDGPYNHDDWPKHQPVIPVLGAQWDASGNRFERHNYSSHVTFRLPLARDVRFRRKWTPQFYLSAFDLNADAVAKIRPIESGRHYIFTTNPARVWLYDGDTVKVYGDFSTAPTVDDAELADDENEDDFDYIDRSGSNIYAPNALDCAVYGGEATGDKVYVVVPPSTDFPRGEVFAFDPDTRQVALEYGIRRENRVPRFIEALGGHVVCLYTHDTGASLPLASKRTRAYDLTFATPTLLWELPETATFCSADDDTLFVACATKLYSTGGVATPTLVHDFGATITAATKTFVGLSNGEVWKKVTDGWLLSLTRPGAIEGTANWSAGTTGEAQTEAAHGVVAGQGAWLVGERANGTWYDERELRVPLDLSPKTVQRVCALDLYSVAVTPATTNDDAAQLPQKDERLLVGTATSGLLFVYQRSLLSEKDGAIPVSHDGTPRLFPFPRRQ